MLPIEYDTAKGVDVGNLVRLVCAWGLDKAFNLFLLILTKIYLMFNVLYYKRCVERAVETALVVERARTADAIEVLKTALVAERARA